MAGILFTNEKVFLAGYKSFKGHITGIGGKQKEGESLFATAIRETIEELFGIKEVTKTSLAFLEKTVQYYKTIENKGYTHFLCSFDEMEIFLNLISITFEKLYYYDEFPKTLADLLLKRKNTERAEISHLCILPYVEDSRIARHLISDINLCVTPVSMK